jgi:hypothetical protein
MPAPSLRSWEPEFIRLWQAAIAEVLGIPIGAVKSRSTNSGPSGLAACGR